LSPDLELLQTYARTRDAQAFSTLVSNYSDMVYGTCLRILRNVADAEDATQECFLRLARDSGKVHTSLGAWLHRCATNECISRVRSSAANHRRERAYEINRQEEKKTSAWGEVSDQVDKALEELPDELREVLVGHFLERRTQTELAAELGVSPATMSRRINEGVEAIRKKLARSGVIVTAVVLGVMLTEHTAQAAPMTLLSSLGKMAIAGPGGSTVGGGTAASGVGAATSASSSLLSGKLLLVCTGAALFAITVACILVWNFARRGAGTGQPAESGGANNALLASSELDAASRQEALAALRPDERQIYEMVYQLRMATPPDKPAAWAQIVRNLAATGKPAVPLLVAELNASHRDEEQRLVLLTLRLIGDPRAVPSLIRAIPRVSAASLEYNFPVNDPETKKFLADHAVAHGAGASWGLSSLDAGVTQCNAALEEITHHSQGREAITNGARSDSPAEYRRDQELRDALADRWAQWWKLHQNEFISTRDLQSLDDARTDLVDPVGLARFGPVFPTGSGVRVGPVEETTLQVVGTWDAKAYIDFDAPGVGGGSGRVYQHNEGWRDESPAQFQDGGDWITQAGVDAYARVTHPTDRAVTSRICMLQGRGLTAWRISDARFDTIDKEIHSGQPLDMGTWGPTQSLIAADPITGAPDYQQFPVTFLFATREGGRGVMQITGLADRGAAIDIRYRMFEGSGITLQQPPLADALAPPAPEQNEKSPTFGQEHEVTLGSPTLRDDSALTLQTGKTMPQEPSEDAMFTLGKREWLETWGGDLLTLTWPNRILCGLGGDQMLALEVSPGAWDSLAPADVQKILARRDPSASETAGTFLIPDPNHDMPATWLLRARAGEIGILQITELSNEHLTVRYKLVNGNE